MKTESKRRELKESLPSTTLEMVHTEACRLLPNRLHLLDRMPKHAKVAEIGVAYGNFSREIFRRCTPEKLYLIDAWATDRYRRGLEAIRTEFAQQIADKTVEFLQGYSTEILSGLKPGTFDWAYIDTNHTYETTFDELVCCARIVGDNGRLAGHDFCTGNVIQPVPYGVIEAVTKFCKDYDWQFEYLTVESNGHFSFCIKKLNRKK